MAQELIRDNLEDLGLDAFNMVEDRSPPPLFPTLEAPLPVIPTDDDIWAVYKMRELQARYLKCVLLAVSRLSNGFVSYFVSE